MSEQAAQKRWAEPMTAQHVAGDDTWTIEAHDDQPIEDGKQYAADLRVLLLLNGERYREFTYPSYRIWTLYAHWTEGLPDLSHPEQDGPR